MRWLKRKLESFGESGITRYTGRVLGVEGRVYMIPHDSKSIGILNPADDSIDTTDPHGFSGSKYFGGGVVGYDGKIYCMSRSSGRVGILELGNTKAACPCYGRVLCPRFLNKF